MRVLSDREVLRVWETGIAEHPVDRALSILASALPGADRDTLAGLSVGRRDGCLMDLREANFGTAVSGVVDCPECGERLGWSFELGDVRVTSGDEGGHLSVEGCELAYRLPDSTDLAAAALCTDPASGRDLIFDRCVLEASRGGERVEPRSLPETVRSGLAAAMDARDPQAEVLLDFACPACDLRWQTPFDILTFLWAEICARALRLLNEVHSLARAYGWAEEDILGMGLARRRFYLGAAT